MTDTEGAHALSLGRRIRWLYPLHKDKPPPSMGVLRMTLNYIWYWGSISRVSLLPGPLLSRMIAHVGISSVGQIDLFKNHTYSLGPCWKNVTK